VIIVYNKANLLRNKDNYFEYFCFAPLIIICDGITFILYSAFIIQVDKMNNLIKFVKLNDCNDGILG
jgi:hypothetical protein